MRLCSVRSGLTTVAVASLVVLSWASPSRAADSWNRIQSKNFVIVGEVAYPRLEYTAKLLEQFRFMTLRMFPARIVEADRPLTVVVLAPGSIRNFGPGRSGNVAGYYQSMADHDYIVMTEGSGGSDLRTILHEYQHAITRNTWQGMPRWANEGIAEFYSTFEATTDGSRYRIGLLIPEHLRTLVTYGDVDLEEFLKDDGRSMKLEERIRVGVFYAESWALVHYFVFGDDGKWSKTFAPFVQALADKEDPVVAFHRIVTPDTKAFQNGLRAYVRRDALPATTAAAGVGADEVVTTASARGKLSIAETETLKARLSNDADRWRKSIADALVADPGYRPALAMRAEALLRFDHDSAKAADELSALVKADASDARLCGLAMFASNARGRHEEALSTCPDNTGFDVGTAFERAMALEELGRAADAAPMYASLATADPGAIQDITWRAWQYLEAGAYRPAIRAADLLVARDTTAADGTAYLRFVHAVARCLLKQCDEAREELKQVGIPAGASAWVQTVFQFQGGALTADAFLKKATRKNEETEAHSYVALDLLGRGRPQDAIPHLQWVLDHGTRDVREYHVATAHYRRLTAR